MSGFKRLVTVLCAVSAALWMQAASAAVVTWTIELDTRFDTSFSQGTTFTTIVPRTITIQTVIDASSTITGPFENFPGVTTVVQDFAATLGATSPLSAEFDSLRQTRGSTTELSSFQGFDLYDTRPFQPGAPSFTFMGLNVFIQSVECDTASCSDPNSTTESLFSEQIGIDMYNESLNSSVADVQPLALEDYLGLLDLPGTVTRFRSSGFQQTFERATCDASGACTGGGVIASTGVEYTGRVLGVSVLAVPEPGALGLVGLALAGLAVSRRRRGV